MPRRRKLHGLDMLLRQSCAVATISRGSIINSEAHDALFEIHLSVLLIRQSSRDRHVPSQVYAAMELAFYNKLAWGGVLVSRARHNLQSMRLLLPSENTGAPCTSTFWG